MKNIKDKVKTAFENETPNIKSKVLTSIENEVQLPCDAVEKPRSISTLFKRIAVAVSFCLIFVVGIVSGYFIPKNSDDSVPLSAENFVYLDVNPSVELSLSSDNLVVSCTAGNSDAEKILQGLNLSGVELNTALSAIVGSMYVNGYLSLEENSMLISVDGVSEEKTTELLSLITQKVNKVFENSEVDCSIIAQSVKGNSELVNKAKDNGVSIGKMQLIDKLIGSFDEFDETSVSNLSKMTIKELNLIYNNKPSDDESGGINDIVSGILGGYLDENGALSAVKEFLEITSSEIENYSVRIKPSIIGGISLKYQVIVTLKSGSEYKFEVDCKTGDVSLLETSPTQGEPNRNEQSGHHGEGGR